jgi:hypothetical protein
MMAHVSPLDTPTPYPSPHGGGEFCAGLDLSEVSAGKVSPTPVTSLPLVGRGKGWGYCDGPQRNRNLPATMPEEEVHV